MQAVVEVQTRHHSCRALGLGQVTRQSPSLSSVIEGNYSLGLSYSGDDQGNEFIDLDLDLEQNLH